MTAVYDANGKEISPRQQFPNNMIPINRISPVALAVTKYMPLPNFSSPGSGYSFNNLRIPTYFDTDKFYNLILKFDWNVGEKNRIFFRHASNDRTEYRSVNGIIGPGEDGQQPFQRINDAYVADWVRTFNPTLVFDARVSYNRFIEKGLGANNAGFDLTNLGLSPGLISQLPQPAYFGEWQINGYQNLGRSRGTNITDDYSLSVNVTKVWGKHSIHSGIDLRWNQYAIKDTGNILQFAVDGSYTSSDWQNPEGLSGNSYASFLLGYQNRNTDSNNNEFNPSVFAPAYPFFKKWYVAPFVQDDWKITPKLTLNLGLRWDFNLPPYEIHNRLNGEFEANAASPIANMISPANLALYPQLANLTGSMTFAGVNGQPTLASQTRFANFQPRAGFAYRITDKLVMRGGYGRYFLNPNNNYLQTYGFSNTTPMVTSLDGGRTPIANILSNPYSNGINPPPGASLGALSYVGQGFNWFDHGFQVPNSNQFSFGFQYQVTQASFLEAKYVGNYISNLQTAVNAYNQPGLAVRQTCNLLEGGSPEYCNAQVPNPFLGLAPFQGTTLYTSPTVNRYQMLRPFPQFLELTQYGRNDGFVHYNSFQATYNYRFRGGLTLNANYTFSKQVEQYGYNDYQARVPETSLYYQDRPHVVKITPVYQLPFGDGQRFGSGANAFVRKLISGWTANAFFSYNSGVPADLPGNAIPLGNPAVNTNFSDYKPRGWKSCVLQQLNDGTIQPLQNSLNAGCGTDQSNYNWLVLPSYAPRATPLRSGQIRMWGSYTMDASLNKTTHITERLSAQFRVEAFNVLNHFFDIYEKFNTDPFSTNFGTIIPSTTWIGNTVYPRQIQLGFKVNW